MLSAQRNNYVRYKINNKIEVLLKEDRMYTVRAFGDIDFMFILRSHIFYYIPYEAPSIYIPFGTYYKKEFIELNIRT